MTSWETSKLPAGGAGRHGRALLGSSWLREWAAAGGGGGGGGGIDSEGEGGRGGGGISRLGGGTDDDGGGAGWNSDWADAAVGSRVAGRGAAYSSGEEEDTGEKPPRGPAAEAEATGGGAKAAECVRFGGAK